MPLLAIVFGILLDLLGTIAFVATGATHVTALIPCIFGMLLLLCGVIAKIKEPARKHAMHAAAMVGLLGTLGGLGMGLPKIGALIQGTAQRPGAVVSQIALGILCLIFVILCVRSFINARKARPQDYGSPTPQ